MILKATAIQLWKIVGSIIFVSDTDEVLSFSREVNKKTILARLIFLENQ